MLKTINDNDLILITCWVIFCLSVLTLIYTHTDKRPKTKLIKSIPTKENNIVNKVMSNSLFSSMITYLTTANGYKYDSPERLISEIIKGSVLGTICLVSSILVGKLTIGIALFLLFVLYPIVGRYFDKKSYKKKYISGFFEFLNYITLYLSGGVPMKRALVEVDKIIDEKNPLKEKLKDVVASNAISGFAGDTYIAALEELNRGLNFSEINTFISSAKRSLDRGDSMSDTLVLQIKDIDAKQEIQKRTYITNQESNFSFLQIAFGMIPTLIIFLIPVFISALLTLSSVM